MPILYLLGEIRGVELFMDDARCGSHPLHITGANDTFVTFRVPMLDLTLYTEYR